MPAPVLLPANLSSISNTHGGPALTTLPGTQIEAVDHVEHDRRAKLGCVLSCLVRHGMHNLDPGTTQFQETAKQQNEATYRVFS